MNPEEDLWEELAQLVPEEKREAYWKYLAHLKTLHPQDEILRLCQAIGFLPLLIRTVPLELAQERERWKLILAESEKLLSQIQEERRKVFSEVASIENKLRDVCKGMNKCADEVRLDLKNATMLMKSQIMADEIMRRIEPEVIEKSQLALAEAKANTERMAQLILKVDQAFEFWRKIYWGWILVAVVLLLILIFK